MWDEMIEADMRRRYFGRMAGRHETVERILSVSMVVASSATAVVVIGFIDFGAELLALCSAVLAAVAGKLQFGRSSMKNAEFSVVWGHVHSEYSDLWIDIESQRLSHNDVFEQLRALRHRHEDIDRQTTASPVKSKILSDCFHEAEKMALAP